ncbi:MAG: hypothetical protein R6U32_06055 [Candidatus Woesearchaeota archaeon]
MRNEQAGCDCDGRFLEYWTKYTHDIEEMKSKSGGAEGDGGDNVVAEASGGPGGET